MVGGVKTLCMVLALSLGGCSIVRSSRVHPNWAQGDQQTVRRLAVIVAPLPNRDQKAGELFARIARRYVNMKRDFIVKQERFQHEAPVTSMACGGEDNIEGVLLIQPQLTKHPTGFEIDLVGRLLRCPDGQEDWSAEAGGSFASVDEGLVEVTGVYVREIGPEVAPYVAPALNVLRPLLDTLPQPILTEDDVNEKLSVE